MSANILKQPQPSCRLCLQKTDNSNQDLYDTLGRRTEVYELVTKYFSAELLQMEWGKHLTTVCTKCWGQIDEFHNFHKSVLVHQDTLKAQFESLQRDEKENLLVTVTATRCSMEELEDVSLKTDSVATLARLSELLHHNDEMSSEYEVESSVSGGTSQAIEQQANLMTSREVRMQNNDQLPSEDVAHTSVALNEGKCLSENAPALDDEVSVKWEQLELEQTQISRPIVNISQNTNISEDTGISLPEPFVDVKSPIDDIPAEPQATISTINDDICDENSEVSDHANEELDEFDDPVGTFIGGEFDNSATETADLESCATKSCSSDDELPLRQYAAITSSLSRIKDQHDKKNETSKENTATKWRISQPTICIKRCEVGSNGNKSEENKRVSLRLKITKLNEESLIEGKSREGLASDGCRKTTQVENSETIQPDDSIVAKKTKEKSKNKRQLQTAIACNTLATDSTAFERDLESNVARTTNTRDKRQLQTAIECNTLATDSIAFERNLESNECNTLATDLTAIECNILATDSTAFGRDLESNYARTTNTRNKRQLRTAIECNTLATDSIAFERDLESQVNANNARTTNPRTINHEDNQTTGITKVVNQQNALNLDSTKDSNNREPPATGVSTAKDSTIQSKNEIKIENLDSETPNKSKPVYKKRIKYSYLKHVKRPQTVQEYDDFIAKWRPNLECVICQETCSTFSLLQQHFSEHHPTEKCYISCCQIKFYYRYEIQMHIYYHSAPKAFKCEVCCKCYTTKLYLQQHLESAHSGRVAENKFKCHKCPRAFERKSVLERHLRQSCHKMTQIENERQFKCDDCGRKYKTKICLRMHQKADHRQARLKKFKCDICDKAYYAAQALREHQNTHKGVYEVACEWCSQKCIGVLQLYNHNRRYHFKEYEQKQKEKEEQRKIKKIYNCPNCEKVYQTPLALKEHQIVHNGNKLYRCKLCPKEYKYSSNVAAHVNRVHKQVGAPKKASKRKRENQESKTKKRKKESHKEKEDQRTNDTLLENEEQPNNVQKTIETPLLKKVRKQKKSEQQEKGDQRTNDSPQVEKTRETSQIRKQKKSEQDKILQNEETSQQTDFQQKKEDQQKSKLLQEREEQPKKMQKTRETAQIKKIGKQKKSEQDKIAPNEETPE